MGAAQPTRDLQPAPAERRPSQFKGQEPQVAGAGATSGRATVAPGALSPRGVAQLQRMVGNRAMSQMLSRRSPTVQRAVSASASWTPAGPEATLISQLDAQIPAAEIAAVSAVQTATGIKTARQANYIQNPSPTTWGYVVEEQLDPLASGSGWQTQQVLRGARPDYFRLSNGIEVYADLTTVAQAGVGGNHITDKLDNAGFLSPDNAVAAADVTHQNLNPRGAVGGAIVVGNATMQEVQALQHYRRFSKQYLGKQVEIDFNPRLEKLVRQYGKIKHDTFTTRWKSKKRKKFADQVQHALTHPQTVDFKKHRTRSQARGKVK